MDKQRGERERVGLGQTNHLICCCKKAWGGGGDGGGRESELTLLKMQSFLRHKFEVFQGGTVWRIHSHLGEEKPCQLVGKKGIEKAQKKYSHRYAGRW